MYKSKSMSRKKRDYMGDVNKLCLSWKANQQQLISPERVVEKVQKETHSCLTHKIIY